jgi:hypothetical protein
MGRRWRDSRESGGVIIRAEGASYRFDTIVESNIETAMAGIEPAHETLQKTRWARHVQSVRALAGAAARPDVADQRAIRYRQSLAPGKSALLSLPSRG